MKGTAKATRPKAVIFDLDGTLVDSVDTVIRSLHEAFARIGARTPRRRLVELEGIPAVEKARILLPRKRWGEIDELISVRRSIELRDFRKLALFAGVPRTLAWLDKKGIKVAVASASSRRRVKQLLSAFGLLGHVNVIIGRDDYRRGRPHPDILLAAARKLKVKPEECMAVGDTKYDVEAARRAGCIPIAVLSGTHTRKVILSKRPDFMIRRISELPKLMEDEFGK